MKFNVIWPNNMNYQCFRNGVIWMWYWFILGFFFIFTQGANNQSWTLWLLDLIIIASLARSFSLFLEHIAVLLCAAIVVASSSSLSYEETVKAASWLCQAKIINCLLLLYSTWAAMALNWLCIPYKLRCDRVIVFVYEFVLMNNNNNNNKKTQQQQKCNVYEEKKKWLFIRLCSATSARLKQRIIKIVSWKTVSSFWILFSGSLFPYFFFVAHLRMHKEVWITWFAWRDKWKNKEPIFGPRTCCIWLNAQINTSNVDKQTKRAPFASWILNLALYFIAGWLPHSNKSYIKHE